MNYCLFTLLLLLTSTVLAQNFNNDVKVEPDPVVKLYEEKKIPAIKKEVTFRRMGATTNTKDTTHIKLYDQEGNNVQHIYFGQDRKREVITESTFQDNLITATTIEYIKVENKRDVISYTYDEHSNIITSLEYNIRNLDTTFIRLRRYKYDEHHNLVEKTSYAATVRQGLKQFSQKAVMEYDTQNRLTQHSHFTPIGLYIPRSKYYYTTEHQHLARVTRSYAKEGEEQTVLNYTNFQYDTVGNLIHKEIFDGKKKETNQVINHFRYEYIDNQLVRAKHFKDTTLVLTVNYHYKGGFLILLEAVRGEVNDLSSLFYFPNSGIRRIRMEHIRNEKGVLQEQRMYYDDRLYRTDFWEQSYF